jgi:hypothetical protein
MITIADLVITAKRAWQSLSRSVNFAQLGKWFDLILQFRSPEPGVWSPNENLKTH